MTIISAGKRLFLWIVTACRILVGFLVMQAGIELMRGEIFIGYNRDPLLTGGFIMILGLYFVFSSFFPLFPKDDS